MSVSYNDILVQITAYSSLSNVKGQFPNSVVSSTRTEVPRLPYYSMYCNNVYYIRSTVLCTVYKQMQFE